MISVAKAKKIGINACIDKIGRDICIKHADNAVYGYGRDGDYVNCFVGVNDEPAPVTDPDDLSKLVLTHEKNWKYSASCDVSLQDGSVVF